MAFGGFLQSIEAANRAVDDKRLTWSLRVRDRAALGKEIESRAQRAMSYLESHSAWARHSESAKPIYRKLRGYAPAKRKAPEGDAPAGKKKGTGAQQSFSDIGGLFSELVAALGKIPGYAPPAADLTLANLAALDGAFSTASDEVGGLATDVSLLVRERAALYEALAKKARAIKAAVSAQYGPKSAEFTTIKGLGSSRAAPCRGDRVPAMPGAMNRRSRGLRSPAQPIMRVARGDLLN